MPRRQVVAIRTETIALGALLKWAGVVATGGEAKTLIAGRRVLVNGQVETRRGRRVGAGDLVAVQGGPTLVVERADGVPHPPALAADVP
ncbi:MAG: RNA-binding S4 domain-containing protein [Armatimonadota bacterium]|nr:RNA-binding S4 domain-containing protein [Armatimonadota bacterium]MDR7421000.1 RNA-binding S4 domain-containing protein [Armatimonadota bacterium]MDR7453303.1 RNA-binding S4 domain-containing protein [Armatimonadota bacterium]MDR7457722.1 RNA-binding S4 domain-containing protein [Armatimonadota bacterium]MDR7497435.1 RNA-binding S4 domain-containing protein [Armatimonadota bacterium]